MNKNLNNVRIYRTQEGTIFEVACAIIIILSFILSIVQLSRGHHLGGAMLMQTIISGVSILLLLVLAYAPHTFNIPDDSPAELYWATVRLLRIIAVLAALLSLGITLCSLFGFEPKLLIIVFVVACIVLCVWHQVKQTRMKKRSRLTNFDGKSENSSV